MHPALSRTLPLTRRRGGLPLSQSQNRTQVSRAEKMRHLEKLCANDILTILLTLNAVTTLLILRHHSAQTAADRKKKQDARRSAKEAPLPETVASDYGVPVDATDKERRVQYSLVWRRAVWDHSM